MQNKNEPPAEDWKTEWPKYWIHLKDLFIVKSEDDKGKWWDGIQWIKQSGKPLLKVIEYNNTKDWQQIPSTEAEAIVKGGEKEFYQSTSPVDHPTIEQDPLCQCGHKRSEHIGIGNSCWHRYKGFMDCKCHNFTPAKAESIFSELRREMHRHREEVQKILVKYEV